MSTIRIHRPVFWLAALVLTVAGCASDAGTAPTRMAPTAPARAVGTIGSVFNVQLRQFPNDPIFPTDPTIPTDPLYGFGNLQVRLGSLIDDSCLPPNPITPQPGYTVVSVCGRIFNEGGALYRGGGIYYSNDVFGDGSILVTQFSGAIPNDPCRRYEISGAALVSDATAADMVANPGAYFVNFDGDIGGESTWIGGRLDGAAWGTAYSPGEPLSAVGPVLRDEGLRHHHHAVTRARAGRPSVARLTTPVARSHARRVAAARTPPPRSRRARARANSPSARGGCARSRRRPGSRARAAPRSSSPPPS